MTIVGEKRHLTIFFVKLHKRLKFKKVTLQVKIQKKKN